MITNQGTFRTALLDPTQDVPDGLSDGTGRSAGKRFAVYRNNVTVALVEALQVAFPVVRKLIGDRNFDQLAQIFVRAHPPSSPLMMHYGAALPRFLDTFDPLKHIGYLSDVARLEQALRRAYHAADPPTFDAARLTSLNANKLMGCGLILAAPLQVVPSHWPLFDIWHFNTDDNAPKPQPVAQTVLVARPDFDPVLRLLTPAEAAWFGKISDSETLGDAQAAAVAEAPEFDLSPLLTRLLQDNAIADLKIPKD